MPTRRIFCASGGSPTLGLCASAGANISGVNASASQRAMASPPVSVVGLESTDPLTPAKAGVQCFLDSRLRGNERKENSRIHISAVDRDGLAGDEIAFR